MVYFLFKVFHPFAKIAHVVETLPNEPVPKVV